MLDFFPSIVNADCRTVVPFLPMESVHTCITDPPFALDTSKRVYSSFGNPEVTTSFEFDRHILETPGVSVEEAYTEFSRSWIKPLREILKPTGNIFVFTTYDRDHIIKKVLKEAGFRFQRTLVWSKTNPIPRLTKREFIYSHEFIVWATLSDKYVYNWQDNFHDNHSVLHGPLPGTGERVKKGFPQKPEWLIERLIKVATNEGDTVIDPFGGTGTTFVVCRRLNRLCLTTEVDPEMSQVIVNRVEGLKS